MNADVSKGLKAFQTEYGDRSIDVAKAFQKRSWNVLAQRNADYERHGVLKLLMTVSAFLAGTAGTLALKEPKWIVCTWVLAVGVFLWADGLHFFDRFLSSRSRIMLAVDAAGIVGCIVHPKANLISLTAIMVVISGLLIKELNAAWLASEMWLLSDVGQSALRTDAENQATGSWQAHGRRETRSIMVQLGIEATDDVLDVVLKPIWLAGFLFADRLTEGIRTKEEKVQKMKDDLSDAREQILKLKEDLRQATAENRQIASAANDAKENADGSLIQIRLLQLQVKNLTAERDDLLRTNDELMNHVRSQQDQAIIPMESPQDKVSMIRQYMAAGLSQNKAGALAGLSKAATSRLLHQQEKAS